jgi:streptomycin 6-kinase
MSLVPERLRQTVGWDDIGRRWLDSLPRLVEECLANWDLVYEHTIPSTFSFVAFVVRADGTPAVLKLCFPEPPAEAEGRALQVWNGDGALLAYEADEDRVALLLERLDPGTPLWDVEDEDEAFTIAAGLMRRLWREPRDGIPGARPLLDAIARDALSRRQRPSQLA